MALAELEPRLNRLGGLDSQIFELRNQRDDAGVDLWGLDRICTFVDFHCDPPRIQGPYVPLWGQFFKNCKDRGCSIT
jgi:hypothetical protein